MYTYSKRGLGYSGKSRHDMPLFLRQSLTCKEVDDKIELAHKISRKHVVWKWGQASFITFGFLSYIKSNHRNSYGEVTQEAVVVDWCNDRKQDHFSEEGDAGSLVFDSDGDACGLLWGSTPESPFTYITPIEYVLEDIREKCNAKEVKFVVRDEDRKDTAS